MYWQRSYLTNSLGLGATSGTETIDLPKSAMLSQLDIRLFATNGSNPNCDNPIMDVITKIEVTVDGSTVIKSLTGKEARMLAALNSGKVPAGYDNELATDTTWQNFPIHFGRFPGDLKYGLDCSKYVNPQLKVTWDSTVVGLQTDSLYSTSTYPVLDVLATQLMEGGSFPGGVIKSHQIKTHTYSSNSEELRVEVPTGHMLRRLLLWCTEDVGYYMQSRLAKVYVDLNIGVRQPFKMDIEELMQFQRQLHGPFEVNRWIDLTNGDPGKDTYLHWLGYTNVRPIKATYEQAFCVGGGGHKWKWELITEITHAAIATAVFCAMHTVGDLYCGALDIPFDYPAESFMLDTREWTDVDLVVEAAASGISTIAPQIGVVTEEVIP